MTVKDYNNEIGEYVTQTTHRYHLYLAKMLC